MGMLFSAGIFVQSIILARYLSVIDLSSGISLVCCSIRCVD